MKYRIFQVAMLWVLTPCSDVVGYHRFGGSCCVHLHVVILCSNVTRYQLVGCVHWREVHQLPEYLFSVHKCPPLDSTSRSPTYTGFPDRMFVCTSDFHIRATCFSHPIFLDFISILLLPHYLYCDMAQTYLIGITETCHI